MDSIYKCQSFQTDTTLSRAGFQPFRDWVKLLRADVINISFSFPFVKRTALFPEISLQLLLHFAIKNLLSLIFSVLEGFGQTDRGRLRGNPGPEGL